MGKFLLHAITFNHKNANILLREKLVIYETELAEVIYKLKELFNLNDIFILSTCNRTEIYYSSECQIEKDIIKYLLLIKGLNYDNYMPYFECITETKKAVLHLFKMAMGLESQVLGDIQIINQIKKAYQISIEHQSFSPQMHRLMHLIFYTNKIISNETNFRSGTSSIAYSVIELIKKLTVQPQNLKVLVVGLGEIGKNVVKNLTYLESAHIVLTNRTKEKAVALADPFGFQVVDFNHIWQEFAKADIIISSLSVQTPFFTLDNTNALLTTKSKYLIDLSLPRSIDKKLNNYYPHIKLYNLDTLKTVISKTINNRKKEVPRVLEIINTNLSGFYNWIEETSFTPAIQKFKKCLEEIRQNEIKRHIKQLKIEGEDNVQTIDIITKSIMNKIVKLPVVQIKSACKRGESDNFVDALTDLFDLEKVNT